MDSYMNELFKKYRISDRYKEVCRFPESINKTTENISKAYEIQLITKYAEQIIFHAIGRAEKFAISNPNYPYPKEYENNYLEFWLTKSSNYQEANDVIKLLEQYQQAESPLKVDPPNKIVFNFTDKQIEFLYENLKVDYISCEYDVFEKLCKNKNSEHKIKWKLSTMGKYPAKKALVEFFIFWNERKNTLIEGNPFFIDIPKNIKEDIIKADLEKFIKKWFLVKKKDSTKWIEAIIQNANFPTNIKNTQNSKNNRINPYSQHYVEKYPEFFLSINSINKPNN